MRVGTATRVGGTLCGTALGLAWARDLLSLPRGADDPTRHGNVWIHHSRQRTHVVNSGYVSHGWTSPVFILPSPVFSPYLMFTNRIDKDISAAAHEAPGSNEAAPPSNRVVVSDDEVEAAITRARGLQMLCRECGPRPEPDAVYCSSCGVLLAAR